MMGGSNMVTQQYAEVKKKMTFSKENIINIACKALVAVVGSYVCYLATVNYFHGVQLIWKLIKIFI
jgi:hypothetical protein